MIGFQLGCALFLDCDVWTDEPVSHAYRPSHGAYRFFEAEARQRRLKAQASASVKVPGEIRAKKQYLIYDFANRSNE
jgi:hypothetical protein